MSRVAKKPVALPKGVTTTVDGSTVTVKGAKGTLKHAAASGLELVQEGQEVARRDRRAQQGIADDAGTLRAHLANMVQGVSKGYERKLELVGVGYRAAAQGKDLNLTLGFSHPVVYDVPEGITIETPTQTEILVKGADKQQVGQVAAEIRGSVRRSPTRARACVTPASRSSSRKRRRSNGCRHGKESQSFKDEPVAAAPRSTSCASCACSVQRTAQHIYAQVFDAGVARCWRRLDRCRRT